MCVNMDIRDKDERAYKHLTLCRIRTMYNGSRRDAEEGTDFSLNPDPVPYQPSNFMSSTMMKKVPLSRRHLDNFGSIDVATGLGKRGVMLHTDRYQWDIARALDGLSQRERLQAEIEYMERLRGIKRRREVLPHRAQLDLLMGGKKIEFTERFEIQREIQKLRSLILPQHAKDLFHGRGFTLPDTHNSLKPRRTLPFDIDLEEDLGSPFSPDKYSFNPETGRVHPKWQKGEGSSTLPKINNKGYLLGVSQPPYMTRSKTNVVSGHSKQVPGRSLTAMPSKKENAHRPAATAPTVPSVMTAGNKEIKIPVSARDPEEGELNPGTTPAVPKTTPSLDSGKNMIEEEPADLMLEEWPDIQEDKELDRSQPSRLSVARSATSPTKAPTPNPLKGSELVRSLSVEEQTRLKQTFNKLDTDKDGHIKFSQLQTQLPKQFSQSQEKYIKQVYEITSSSTFFGVDEFMTMSYLTNIVTDLRGEALEAYNNIEFHNLHEVILQYVDLFQSIDRGHRGKVSLDSLQDILSSALSIDLKADSQTWDHITDTLSLTEPGLISKIEFLANIPYFQMTGKKK